MTLDKYMINYFFQYMMDELKELVKTTIEKFPVSSRNYAAVFRNTLLTGHLCRVGLQIFFNYKFLNLECGSGSSYLRYRYLSLVPWADLDQGVGIKLKAQLYISSFSFQISFF
jgi:hypothetical protein